MKKKYSHQKIEKKWLKKWQEWQINRVFEDEKKPKKYILDMFPYPSGAGLHVGHPKGYIATDILARYYKMKGFNVLHPMGWDAFGLPAENYAIKNQIHPEIATKANISRFKNQLNKIGLNYDWEREINTTDSNYYKFTQEIFLKLFNSYYDQKLDKAQPIEKLIKNPQVKILAQKAKMTIAEYINNQRLVYQSFEPINWCPSCKTGLANEDLEDGCCERCGSLVEKKPLRQWIIRITKYAPRLLNDLKLLPNWEEFIKEMQIHWIGQSFGTEVSFQLKLEKTTKFSYVKIFTTRLDTIFGCTYLVLSPEHQLVSTWLSSLTNKEEIIAYNKSLKKKTDLKRSRLEKNKTGVVLQNVIAVHPLTKQPLPVLIADYVLKDYGTGAVMGVPAHDERDFVFAKKYGLNLQKVIVDSELKVKRHQHQTLLIDAPEINDGFLINSSKYNGLSSQQARKIITIDLLSKKMASKKVNYKIRDWVFSRQRYWGEPIPLIHCPKCGVVAERENDLPLKLPKVKNYQPTGTGESPLINIKSWVEITCPFCHSLAKRETNTMPQWAGSSWYYLRFMDPHNHQRFVDVEKEKYWQNVDIYVGGTEHATRHLIYARFWHKFLYDLGLVSTLEPFDKLQHVGLILASDGQKMSKRFGNVINPDDIIEKYGADALRLYEMFLGPFEQTVSWDEKGVVGVKKFLDKLWQLSYKTITTVSLSNREEYLSLLHQTIKKVSYDIENFKFNTAVSALMILVNKLEKVKLIQRDDFFNLVLLIAPLCPFIAEELASTMGLKSSIFTQNWPQFNSNFIKIKSFILPVQINGKIRAKLIINEELKDNKESILRLVNKETNLKKYLKDKELKKVIYVNGRILNLVV